MSVSKKVTELRERMTGQGFATDAVVSQIMREFGYRPRAAWRLAHGLSQDTAAQRFNARYGSATRAPMSASRLSAYERWPVRGERPSVATLCRLAMMYGAGPGDLVDRSDLDHAPRADRPAYQELITRRGAEITPSTHEQLTRVAYRQRESEPDGPYDPMEVLMAAAHEGSEHAEDAERRDIGDATLEQLRADVVRLAGDILTAEPFPVFQEMRRVRRRIYTALDRRIWPRDQVELFFLLGVLNTLMAVTADDMGTPRAAEELTRAAWAYATAIDHHPLMAHIRIHMAVISFWNRPRHSRTLAEGGLRYLSDGPNGAQLHLQIGRAAARLGDIDTARRSIAAAHEARARDHTDELLEIGGEFTLSVATQHYMAGSGLIEIAGAETDAITELEQASGLYAAGPAPGEEHGFGMVALTHLDLATAHLRNGQLDQAAVTLEPVLQLPPALRIEALPKRLQRVRSTLAAPRYRHDTLATALDERIEDFCDDTITLDLTGPDTIT